MGPDGSTEGAVLCKDLPYSHATCVGSWLLPPEHHIVEGMLVTIVSLLILAVTVPKLLLMLKNRSDIHIKHPPGARLVSLFASP